MSDKEIHFYLFHSRIEKETIALLEKFCLSGNVIQFHEIVVPHADAYVQLAKRGGGWCGCKPWRVQYPTTVSAFQNGELQSIDSLKLGQREYYQMWYEYAVKASAILEGL